MRRTFERFVKHHRGIAALEFGLCAPFLIAGMAAAFDYGYAVWAQSCVSTAVAEGAYYAATTGTSVTAANIKYIVQNATPLTGIQVASNGVSSQFYACPYGTPATLNTTGVTASTSCPLPPATSGTGGGNAGVYITITATYTLTAIWQTSPTLITETATVRIA